MPEPHSRVWEARYFRPLHLRSSAYNALFCRSLKAQDIRFLGRLSRDPPGLVGKEHRL